MLHCLVISKFPTINLQVVFFANHADASITKFSKFALLGDAKEFNICKNYKIQVTNNMLELSATQANSIQIET
jgi:hypothetical protein